MTSITERQQDQNGLQSALTETEALYDLQVLFDDVVKRETDHHPELNSRRKKMIFVQNTFQWWNVAEVANIFRTTEQEARRFLSRRGIRRTEFAEIEDQFNGVFAIASIIAKHVEGLLPRRDTLAKPNGLLENWGVKAVLLHGNVKAAVEVAQMTYDKFHREN